MSSGFNGKCQCKILGACDAHGNPVPNLDKKLTNYAPSGMEQFAYARKNNGPAVAYVCEGGEIAILFDCNAMIPLYSATVMEQAQIHFSGNVNREGFNFRASQELSPKFQQSTADYQRSNSRDVNYESVGQLFVDVAWNLANQQQKMSPVDKGHMVAALYASGPPPTFIKETFVYTNAVPQFAAFNRGQWKVCEGYLLKTWATQNCPSSQHAVTQNVRLYIVVGAVPSTSNRQSPRFFGAPGFSNFQGPSQLQNTYSAGSGGGEYRANVPSHMWTAACCTYQFQDSQGLWQDETKSVAYLAENKPHKGQGCNPITVQMLTSRLTSQFAVGPIVIFPQNANCN